VADTRVPAEQWLGQHRRPLDFEHHRELAADVPDRVDLREGIDRLADRAEIGVSLSLIEDVTQVAATVAAAVLTFGDPHAQTESMARVRDRRQEVGVLLAPP